MNPEQLSDARIRLTQCRTAHEVAALCLSLLGVSRDTAYQAMPQMNQRTVRRITAGLSECDGQDAQSGGLRDAVRRYTSFKSLQDKKHIPADRTVPGLPAELEPVREAAQRATVSVTKALEAVARYGNPVEVVLRRLSDLSALREVVQVRNPTGLFVHLMRHGKEVTLPDAVRAKREQATQPQAEPVRAGDALTYYGEAATVQDVRGVSCLVVTASGEEYLMPCEQAQRLRDLPSPAAQGRPAEVRREPVDVCPAGVALGLLESLRRKLGKSTAGTA